MATKVFINLPVKDLKRSVDFFTKLGFKFNLQFTNEDATCMIVSEDISVMLLVEKFFKSFTNKEIPDTKTGSEVIISISADSRSAVDEFIKKAIAAGASTPMNKQDHGWMYVHGFQDLDGHLWESAYIDESAIPKQ